MADDNYNPVFSEPMNDNDIPNKKEITEKPNCEDIPAPTPQLLNNYNPPLNYNEDLPSKENLQQGNQTIPVEPPYYQSNNNNYDIKIQYEQPVKKRKNRMGENPKELKVLSILLIIIIGLDAFLEALFLNSKFYILIDDIAVLTMAIIYLVLISKKMPTNHRVLGIVTIIVWIVGFGLKFYGIIIVGEPMNFAGFVVPFCILTSARFFIMFFCIPHTINNYPRE